MSDKICTLDEIKSIAIRSREDMTLLLYICSVPMPAGKLLHRAIWISGLTADR